MAKDNLEYHPLIHKIEDTINQTNNFYKPVILFRGFAIEASIAIDFRIDGIILDFLFSNGLNEAKLLFGESGRRIKYYNHLITYRATLSYGKKKQCFYKEKLINAASEKRIQWLMLILDYIEINNQSLTDFNTLEETLNRFYNIRHRAAHYRWELISTGNEEPEIQYGKLSGDEKISIKEPEIDLFKSDYERLKNNLDLIWFTRFISKRV